MKLLFFLILKMEHLKFWIYSKPTPYWTGISGIVGILIIILQTIMPTWLAPNPVSQLTFPTVPLLADLCRRCRSICHCSACRSSAAVGYRCQRGQQRGCAVSGSVRGGSQKQRPPVQLHAAVPRGGGARRQDVAGEFTVRTSFRADGQHHWCWPGADAGHTG